MNFKYLGLVLFLSIVPLLGQAIVKQGSEADLKQGEFTSPMVIELPLDRLKIEELSLIHI